MGLLTLFSRAPEIKLVRLPTGSYTLDKDGRIMTSTLPRSFPEEYLRDIGRHILTALQEARKAQIPLAEIVVHYATLKLQARELRGGAMIFITPSR
jgi:hypothetical protein